MLSFLKKYPYFAENGITATSANYIANLGKEYYRSVLNELNALAFYSSEANIAGTEGSYPLSCSTDAVTFDAIPEKLKKIYTVNALIAWLREAIKKRKAMLEDLDSVFDLDRVTGETPVYFDPQIEFIRNEPKSAEMIEDFDVDTVWQYTYEHERIKAFKNAYAELGRRIKDLDADLCKIEELENNLADGKKIDCVCYTNKTVDKAEAQKMLDLFKSVFMEATSNIEPMVKEHEKRNSARKSDSQDALTGVLRQKSAYETKSYNDTKMYKSAEKSRISKLKIVIPDTLMPIFEELNNLHKS